MKEHFIDHLNRSAAAILSIGAATLADIYEPHERGTMMGIYYWYVLSRLLLKIGFLTSSLN